MEILFQKLKTLKQYVFYFYGQTSYVLLTFQINLTGLLEWIIEDAHKHFFLNFILYFKEKATDPCSPATRLLQQLAPFTFRSKVM